jgi:hypothetical protein
MKKIVPLMTSLCAILFFNCQEKKANPEVSKNEIIKVIENETKTFYKKDFNAWSSNFVQDERIFWVCAEPEMLLRANGWADLSKFIGDWMKENPKPIDYEKALFKINDLKITVQNNMAFVKFNYLNQNKDVAVNNSMENRVLIFDNQKWKIISITSYPNDSDRESGVNVYNYLCK